MPKNDGVDKIDLVVTWVDGNDEVWKKEKAKYANEEKRESKYRDWGLLRFWFRGVERNAPWVNKIHFVTYGHLPEWLNTNHPKLNIVKHTDFIPNKYLPTFSSHVIELNLHRIKGLSEQFIYFNDDMYIISPVKESYFFENGKPCDRAVLTVNCVKESWGIQHFSNNNISVINEEFDFRESLKNNLGKWINLKYGKDLLRNFWLMPCPRFPGIKHDHANSNMLKTTYEDVWRKYHNVLDMTCEHKLRTRTDVNQWIFKDWQIANGQFTPSIKRSKFIDLKFPNSLYEAKKIIEKHKTKILCINDADNIDNAEFNRMKTQLTESFEKVFNEKSSFEK